MVTYNGDFIGYSDSKSKLQEKINDFIENGDGNSSNIAYVQITSMPKYELTFLKNKANNMENNLNNVKAKISELEQSK